MASPTEFGRNVATVRRERGLSQRQLAKLAGTTTIASLESGAVEAPEYATMQRIADALGVSIADLWEGQP